MTNRNELIRQSNQLRREENELKREELSLTQLARGSPSQRAALMRNQELRNKNKRQLRDVTNKLHDLEKLAANEPAGTSATPDEGAGPNASAAPDFPPALPPLAPPPA